MLKYGKYLELLIVLYKGDYYYYSDLFHSLESVCLVIEVDSSRTESAIKMKCSPLPNPLRHNSKCGRKPVGAVRTFLSSSNILSTGAFRQHFDYFSFLVGKVA